MDLVSIYIFDDRYSVPTWQTVDIRLEEAFAFAHHLIATDDHYARVEIWRDDTRIATAQRWMLYARAC